MHPVDLLVFGAHPDDIEIGLGGTVARHVALGFEVGLCDLTAGEMGTNGTVEERLAEADEARAVLGAAWRVNLRLPDRAFGHADHVRAVASHIRQARPRAIAIPYGVDRHPDHVAANRLLIDAVFNAGLRRYEADGEAWRPDWVCSLLHQRLGSAVVRRRRLGVLRHQAPRARLLPEPVPAVRPGRRTDAAHRADVPAVDREP